MTRVLFIFLLITSCGYQAKDEDSLRLTSKEQAIGKAEDLRSQYFSLQGQVSEINNLIYSEFESCENSGDTADQLIRKICQVAQASTIEAKIAMKAELQASVSSLETQLESVNQDLTQVFEDLETVQVDIVTIQSDITTINGTITAIINFLITLDARVSALEAMAGLNGCVRRRNPSPTLNGSMTILLFDVQLVQDSSYCTYNASQAEFTINTSGWYRVNYKTNFQHTNGNTRLTLRSWVYKNNSTLLNYSLGYGYTRQDTQAEFASINISFIDQFTAGDIIEVQTDAASGNGTFGQGTASYILLGPQSYFSLEFIEP